MASAIEKLKQSDAVLNKALASEDINQLVNKVDFDSSGQISYS